LKNRKWLTATNVIILICILVYVIDRFVLGGNYSDIGEISIKIAGKDLGESKLFIELLGFNFGKLYKFMALSINGGKILNLWQPFTYIFMHEFIFHIIVNLIALYILGNKIEKNRGIGLTLFTFIITGVVGVFISNIIVPSDSLTAGSSIAVFGLIGTALGMCFTEKGYIKSFSKKSKIYLAIYGLIFTYTSGPWTMAAHNVGLILGLIIYLIYYYSFYNKKTLVNN